MQVYKTLVGFQGQHITPEYQVLFELTKLAERDLHLTGQLKIRMLCDENEYQLYSGTFNVTSGESRSRLASHLKKLEMPIEEIPWTTLLEAFAQQVLDLYSAPAEVRRFEELEQPSVQFLLYPILPERHISILYAPGGAGKSLFALYLALLIANGFDLEGNAAEPKEVLYIDWEMDYNETNRRYSMLVPPEPVQKNRSPLYYEATLPLVDEFEGIAQTIEANKIQFVILDSAALACGGDIIDAAKVANFFLLLKKLTRFGATVLVISHVSKSAKEKDDRSTPIGSIFFENFSRTTWELKYQIVPNKDSSFLYAVFNRKSNFGKLKPVAIGITFDEGSAYIERANPYMIGVTGNTQEDIILSCMNIEGSMSVDDLAKQTGFKKESIWVVLSHLKKRGIVDQDSKSNKWKVIEKSKIVK